MNGDHQEEKHQGDRESTVVAIAKIEVYQKAQARNIAALVERFDKLHCEDHMVALATLTERIENLRPQGSAKKAAAKTAGIGGVGAAAIVAVFETLKALLSKS